MGQLYPRPAQPATSPILALNPATDRTAAWMKTANYALIATEMEDESGLGAITAAAIEDALVEQDWPVNAVCGPESMLASNFGVSVRLVRQAFRILEIRGACRMRRGPSGGLVVQNPQRADAARALASHMRWTGATPAEVWAARRLIEPMALRRAAINRRHLDLPLDTGRLPLGSLVGNPCFALALDSLEQFPGGLCETVTPLRPDLRAAVERGEDEQAACLALADLEAREADYFRLHGPEWPRQEPRQAVNGNDPHRNLATAVARRIGADVRHERCRDHDRLGSLPDLAQRYDASLAVMVEAVRILEDLGVVESRRGRGGGVVLSVPSPACIMRMVHGFLAAARLDRLQCDDFTDALNTVVIEQAATLGAGGHMRALESIAQGMEQTPSRPSNLLLYLEMMRGIYDIVGNGVLHTLIRCIAGHKTRIYARDIRVSPRHDPTQDLMRAGQMIIRGVLTGDPATARQGQDITAATCRQVQAEVTGTVTPHIVGSI
ncbi:hypothetical protein UCD39_06800 [Nitrospirillum sp. BR 11752]|uniref:FadR/GntR family transcriptional regulator n=1 Tax=Nitrospirillum sp. BR 11752 TaxID=3104293 RepID=UPI002ECE1305|nr:hypothetical protein [Nitrospirillum sp. BR 11752]